MSAVILQELWANARRFWYLLLGAALLGLAAAWLSSLRQPALYDAVGKIQLPQNPISRRAALLRANGDPGAQLLTEMATIAGDRVLNKVATDLDLSHNAVFRTMSADGLLENTASLTPGQLALLRLRRHLQVQLVPKTSIVRIDFFSADPRLAATVVDTVVREFIADRLEAQNRLRTRANDILGPRLRELEQSMTAAQSDMLRLRRKLKAPGYNSRNSVLSEQLSNLALQLADARLKLIRDRNDLNLVLARPQPADGAPTTLPTGDPGRTVFLERERLAQARAQQAALAAVLGQNHPDRIAADARTDTIESEQLAQSQALVQGLRVQAESRHAEVEQLAAELDRQTLESTALAPTLAQYADLQREYTASNRLYERIFRRLRLAPANAAYRAGVVDIVGRASVYRVAQSRPPEQRLPAYALAAMAATLVILTTARSLYWPTLAVPGFESLTRQPALAVLPELKKLGLPDVVAALGRDLPPGHPSHLKWPDVLHPDFVQGLFNLRERLESGPKLNRARRILLTSARPSEGKTTVATSLAIVMARHGRRVLLIDADLRRPTVAKRLKLSSRKGLSDILAGRAALADTVQVLPGAPTLDILASGPIPPDAVKLIESRAMSELLQHATARYDFIVIDAPPVLPVTDSILLAQGTDAVVWVIRANRWQRLALQRTGQLLAAGHAPLCGIVINGFAQPANR